VLRWIQGAFIKLIARSHEGNIINKSSHKQHMATRLTVVPRTPAELELIRKVRDKIIEEDLELLKELAKH